MLDERRKILQMLADGKISAADAERLMEKLDELDGKKVADSSADNAADPVPPVPPGSTLPPGDTSLEGGLTGFIARLIKTGLNSVGVATQTQSRSESTDHQPGMPLRVRTGNGFIHVSKVTGTQVSIRADVRAVTLERLAAVKLRTTREADGTLDIRADWPDGGPRGMEGCSFAIEIPDAIGVDLETSNGAINLEAMGGSALLRTRNGAVDVRAHDGSVRADTTNGKIRLVDVIGNVIAHGSNGRISVERCSGSVEAETTNGSVDVAQTSEGKGPLLLTTTNGSITAEIGRAFRGALRLRTVNGPAEFNEVAGLRVVSRTRNSADLEVGSGTPQSSLRTTNGAVRVTLSPVVEHANVSA